MKLWMRYMNEMYKYLKIKNSLALSDAIFGMGRIKGRTSGMMLNEKAVASLKGCLFVCFSLWNRIKVDSIHSTLEDCCLGEYHPSSSILHNPLQRKSVFQNSLADWWWFPFERYASLLHSHETGRIPPSIWFQSATALRFSSIFMQINFSTLAVPWSKSGVSERE